MVAIAYKNLKGTQKNKTKKKKKKKKKNNNKQTKKKKKKHETEDSVFIKFLHIQQCCLRGCVRP